MTNNASYPPCRVVSGIDDYAHISATAQTPSTFKLTFSPFFRCGTCETAQDGGYINTVRFYTQIDVSKPLHLTVKGHNGAENMYFHYFNVQTYRSG